MTDINALARANASRWSKARLTRDLTSIAKRLVSAKSRYQVVEAKTGVPWWAIAVIHMRESSQSWLRSLAQGDPWNRVSIHVPVGRGPFKSWEEAAVDALANCHPYLARNKDWSIGGTLTMLEQYNGLGYANRGRPSPYIWSGTDQYKSGKYVRDGVYDPGVVDSQPGCAGLLMEMMVLDPTITFTGLMLKPVNSTTAANASTGSSTPATRVPSIAHPSKGSIGAFVANIFSTIFKRK